MVCIHDNRHGLDFQRQRLWLVLYSSMPCKTRLMEPLLIPALTVLQPFASFIEEGKKTIETRIWATKHRGDLLICAGQKWHNGQCCLPHVGKIGISLDLHDHYCRSFKNFPRYFNSNGQALCIADLYDCRPMTHDDEESACCRYYDGAWSWCFRNIRLVKHVPIKGKQRIFQVPQSLITIL